MISIISKVVLLHLVKLNERTPEAMKVRNWTLGSESVSELYEYKNLGVVKNYIGSFSTNADENIEKNTQKSWHDILLKL